MNEFPRKTLQEMADIVDREGLGYAIEDYIKHDRIADPKLSKLWMDAEEIFRKIRDMLPEVDGYFEEEEESDE